MFHKFNGVAKAAASISLAGGILVMAALPAAAASPNDAYAASSTGLIAISPIGEATYPGTSPVSVVNANIAGLLTTGVVTDMASATSASSSIANVGVTLGALATLSATAITSSCTLNTDTGAVSGTAKITGGSLNLSGISLLTLDAAPSRNESVVIPAGLSTIVGSIILNKHTTATDGTLTVDAIYITLLGTTQTLTLGESTCNTASLAAVPVLPVKTLAYSLSGLGVLLIAGLGYQVSRRRRQAEAA